MASLGIDENNSPVVMEYMSSSDAVTLEPKFTRDVRGIGHFGADVLDITIQSARDFEKVKPLRDQSYSAS